MQPTPTRDYPLQQPRPQPRTCSVPDSDVTIDRLFSLINRFYTDKVPADFDMPLRVLKNIDHLPEWVQATFIIIADQLDRTLHSFVVTPELYTNLEALSIAPSLVEQSVIVDTLISNMLTQEYSGQQIDPNISLNLLELLSMDAAHNHATLNRYNGNLTKAISIQFNKHTNEWEASADLKVLEKRSQKRQQWIIFAKALATSQTETVRHKSHISTSKSMYRYFHICRLWYWKADPNPAPS
jgi:hypothetical protein